MEMQPCVICGEQTSNGKSWPLCAKHSKYIYRGTCRICGEWIYGKDLPASTYHQACVKRKEAVRVEVLPPSPEKILHYLVRSRTGKQLQTMFGTGWEPLIRQKFPGFILYDSLRNDYGEQIFILLPELLSKVKVKPKVWDGHIGVDSKGLLDPCLLVQIPVNAFRKHQLIVVPIFDVHLGHKSYREEKFLSYIRWIKENPNIFVILGGDLMENALDDGRGMGYDSTAPKTQYDELIDKLSPIAHKILCSTPGNHERRTYNRSGFEPSEFICDKLKIPYVSGPINMKVASGGYDWTFYIHHGKGNSQTKGGKLNSAQRPHTFVDFINFNISGHVHDLMCDPETVIRWDMEHMCLKFSTRWTVIVPGFLDWKDSYAYRGEMKPAARGGVICKLYDNGEYRANLT